MTDETRPPRRRPTYVALPQDASDDDLVRLIRAAAGGDPDAGPDAPESVAPERDDAPEEEPT